MILRLQSFFSKHDCPDILVAENIPFRSFNLLEFYEVTSIPNHPRYNEYTDCRESSLYFETDGKNVVK